ncbi:MAG: Tm-1-like ATP-binding domain-containing protein [Pirellulales bacterium]
MSEPVYLIATMDSKGHEIEFVSQVLQRGGVQSVMVDVGTYAAPQVTPHIGRDEVLHCIGKAISDLPADRGEAISVMGRALATFLRRRWESGRMGGVLGIGGSGGTALIAEGLRALPIGFPKVLVSTVASGNTAPYIDCCDIMMMFSVVDVAGLNAVSRPILANAANAIAGMTRGENPSQSMKPTISTAMFGVTTPCVDRVRHALTDRATIVSSFMRLVLVEGLWSNSSSPGFDPRGARYHDDRSGR